VGLCGRLKKEYKEEISQKGTLDDPSVTLTIHLLSDIKASKVWGLILNARCSYYTISLLINSHHNKSQDDYREYHHHSWLKGACSQGD